MPRGHDPTFSLSETYDKVERRLSDLSDLELCAVAGALVGEFVNRGNDHDTALHYVTEAAEGGVIGSRMFDAEVD